MENSKEDNFSYRVYYRSMWTKPVVSLFHYNNKSKSDFSI